MKNENKDSTSLLKDERGLTLVEVIAVIVIIGLIMGVVIPAVFKQGAQAKQELNLIKMRAVSNALSQYRLKYNKYPNSLGELQNPPKKSGVVATKFVDNDDLTDLWGNALTYQVENNGRSYVLKSNGADGAPGGEGEDADLDLTP